MDTESGRHGARIRSVMGRIGRGGEDLPRPTVLHDGPHLLAPVCGTGDTCSPGDRARGYRPAARAALEAPPSAHLPTRGVAVSGVPVSRQKKFNYPTTCSKQQPWFGQHLHSTIR